MGELIQNFGINGYLLIAQIVNFLIILYILKRFAYKPILDMLEKRRKTIEEGQKNAEKAEKALQNALVKEKELLRRAQQESREILTQSKQQAEETVSKAVETGRVHVEKMLAEAKEQIAKDRVNMEKELAVNVAQLASDMLRKSMKDLLDAKDADRIVEKAALQLKK